MNALMSMHELGSMEDAFCEQVDTIEYAHQMMSRSLYWSSILGDEESVEELLAEMDMIEDWMEGIQDWEEE